MIATEYCKNVFDGTHDSPKFLDNGYLLVTSKNIANRELDLTGANFISEEDFNKINERSKVHQWDIFFSMIGTVGNVFLQTEKEVNYAIKNMGVFSCENEDKAKWLYYYLQSPYFKKLMNSLLSGAVQKFVPLGFLRSIDIPKYDDNKKAIVKFLSSLDDKIALNNRINAKLEQMAKRLYDYWFVQFDFPVSCHSELVSESHSDEMLNQVQHDECAKPYKSSGGKMVWNEELKREIPEGWEVKKLGEIALVKRGTTITEKDTTKGNVKVVAGGLDFSYYHNQSNRKANCITVSGSGENAGFVNFWREPIFASDCSTAQCENDIDTMLCYFALKMQEKRFYRISHKSAQPHIYPKDVAEIPIVVPNEAVKSKISDFFLKSNWKIALIEKETQKLTALRDRLLPLLMNGQVQI